VIILNNSEEYAKSKLGFLNDALKNQMLVDENDIEEILTPRSFSVYRAAKPYYLKAAGKDYGFDLRHIYVSLKIAIALSDSIDANSNVIVPAILVHDAGRYKTPVGVDKINHSSFAQRLIHMLEGSLLAREQLPLKENGYSTSQINDISDIIAVHDWSYLRNSDIPSELANKENSELVVEFGDTKRSIESIFEELSRIKEKGIMNTEEFKIVEDADRLNVPATASFLKDYWKTNYSNFTPLEFFFLRQSYFGIFDEDNARQEGLSRERIEYILKKTKHQKINFEEAREIVSRIILEKKPIVKQGVLDLQEFNTEDFPRLLESELASENYLLGHVL